jgi:hypothetical protein
MKLPELITVFLEDRKKRISSNVDCSMCNGACCQGSGFAILENIVLIYDKYKRNDLKRDGYEFVSGLSFQQFVNSYFDDCVINGGLKAFFPKTLSENNNLISIPPFGSYWENRTYIKANNRWIKHSGCIFLSKKFNDMDSKPNYCILHDKFADKEITAKPIDCVFLSCSAVKNTVNPTLNETSVWFSLLNYSFQDSDSRYQTLLKT